MSVDNLCVDDMTEEEFDEFLAEGYEGCENGDYVDEEDVFAELQERFGVNARV